MLGCVHTGEVDEHPDAADQRLDRLGDLFLRLTRTAHALHRHSFEELGLTPAQGRALALLGHCGEAPHMSELARRLHVVPRAVTPIIDALEEAGYARRCTDPDNRRSTLLEITDEGRRLCERISENRTHAAGEVFAPLSEQQRDTLTDLLEQVYANRPDWVPDRVTARGADQPPSRPT